MRCPKGPRITSGRLIIRGLGWLESLRGSVRPSLLPLMCRRGFLPSDRRLGWPGFSFTLPRAVFFCDRVWYDSRGQPSPPVMLTTLLCQFSRPLRGRLVPCAESNSPSWDSLASRFALSHQMVGQKITELDFGREQARRTELSYFVKYDAERNRDFMDGCIFQTTHTQQHTHTNTHTHTSSCIRGRGHARLNFEEFSGTIEQTMARSR